MCLASLFYSAMAKIENVKELTEINAIIKQIMIYIFSITNHPRFKFSGIAALNLSIILFNPKIKTHSKIICTKIPLSCRRWSNGEIIFRIHEKIINNATTVP